jgi:hypothetical protein
MTGQWRGAFDQAKFVYNLHSIVANFQVGNE